MIFAQPWLLIGLLLPLGWLLWQWRRRNPVLRLPMDHSAPRQWRRGSVAGLLLALGITPALVAGVAVVLLAGPSQESPPSQRRSLTNIEFCLDVSGSMTAPMDDGKTRYDAAMDAIMVFSQRRAGDAFGLTIFGNIVLHWLPLTRDLDALARSREWLDPAQLPYQFGGTHIGDALAATTTLLAQRDPSSGDRMIVLLTDGQSADLGGDRPQRLISQLKSAEITVFAISIGNAHQAEVTTIVNATGGQVFSADNTTGLEQCFAAIDRLKPVTIERDEPGLVPWRQPWLIALAIVVALELLSLTLARRLPW